MVDLTDISTFRFPTLADPAVQDVLTAVQVLRGESDRKGRRVNPFREADREKFQRDAMASDSRLERTLAALDALAQERPALATFGLMGGPIGAIGGLAALAEGRDAPQSIGDALREVARGGRALTGAQARGIQRRAEREDRESNRSLREGRGSGASPRRGDVSNAGR